MKNILILGGCGYVGSRLYSYLQELGYPVQSIDLEWFGNNNLEWFSNSVSNIRRDFSKIDPSKADIVILLAGHSSVPMCKNDMLSSFHNNVANFVELLAKIQPHQKFIYASSSSVYGETGDVPVPESHNQYDPNTYYDLSKQEIDYYARLSSVEYYGLRFGTVNGWSPNLRVDIMLNKMYKDAIETGRIEVFNKHVFRPILGIEDLCRAVEQIILGEDHRGVYNLASFNASIEEIASNIAQFLGNVAIVDKGTSPTYNFSIDTNKFKTTYNFEFKETVDSIVNALAKNWNNCIKGIRDRRKY